MNRHSTGAARGFPPVAIGFGLVSLIALIPATACSGPSEPTGSTAPSANRTPQPGAASNTNSSAVTWLERIEPVAMRLRIPGLAIAPAADAELRLSGDARGQERCGPEGALDVGITACASLGEGSVDIELRRAGGTPVAMEFEFAGPGGDEIDGSVHFERWTVRDQLWAVAVHVTVDVEGVGRNSCDASSSWSSLRLSAVSDESAEWHTAPAIETHRSQTQVLCDQEGEDGEAPVESWQETTSLEMQQRDDGPDVDITANRVERSRPCAGTAPECAGTESTSSTRWRWQPQSGTLQKMAPAASAP